MVVDSWKDAISSMHVDTEGFATLVLVLEGSKYWIIGTQIGDNEGICSINSLSPNWDPYLTNEGSNSGHYQFGLVHLQKGDMM